mmetsp:Transcript_8236/g.22356  ORF Transcript_8236/g.22356 Transcript_8236/m.22356 type:complete len:103 (+) Transcript_8236:791-1099(+)
MNSFGQGRAENSQTQQSFVALAKMHTSANEPFELQNRFRYFKNSRAVFGGRRWSLPESDCKWIDQQSNLGQCKMGGTSMTRKRPCMLQSAIPLEYGHATYSY